MLAASGPNFFANHPNHPATTVIPYPYYDVNLMVHSPGPIYPGRPYPQNAYLLSEFGSYGPYGPTPMTPSPLSPTGGQTSIAMPLGLAGHSPLLPPRPPLPDPAIKLPPFLPQTLPMSLSPPMTLALPPTAGAQVPPLVQPQGYPPGPPPPAPPAPPRTYLNQPPDEQFLYSVFQRVNRDKSGNISASELQSALSNGTWKPFNPETIRMMIGMFDKQKRGKINFEEFCKLWKYVTDWLHCFQTYDLNESGNIDQEELKVALNNFEQRFFQNK